MKRGFPRFSVTATLVLAAFFATAGFARAQQDAEQGRSIGKISVRGSLIVMELNRRALGTPNLFDLAGRTLHFARQDRGYRVQTLPLQWDSDFGPELTGSQVTLRGFTFPFSGTSWTTLLVGANGSIRFGSAATIPLDPYGHPDGGIILDRFDQLADVAGTLSEKAPAICVFLKPRLSGPRYVKELPGRVVITWDLSEPFGGLLDFSWQKTTNLFQAVLYADGSIEMSYKQMAAKDGIVGIYPVLSGGRKPAAVHFSSASSTGSSFEAAYESFHYVRVPRPQDLSCTVINVLGDNFDFLAYYSDFRMDTQEASPPSDGPIGGSVTGIGNTEHSQTPDALASRCTRGRFQLGLGEPVYVGANEAQAGPPAGAPAGGNHDITSWLSELAQASPGGTPLPYDYAVGHLGHEVGHRWSAYVTAKINGQVIRLGPWPHWAPGLQSRVAFPYSLPTEASTLGGGAWQDNFDGTYTQLRDGYFVPAAGYSYLDLYLMGLISAAEVPDFFILEDLSAAGKDAQGRSIFRARRTKVTIQDVIAAEGPRLPDVDHSQRKFNTGFVVVVEHGHAPSRELIERAEGIRRQWMLYWQTATGGRASMSAHPGPARRGGPAR